MFYKRLIINETEYPIAVNITGEGAPTSDTEGEVGMFYMDSLTGKTYKRTADGWVDVNAEIIGEVIAALPRYNGEVEDVS